MSSKKEKLIKRLKEINIEMKYGPFIHGVDITSNIEEIAHNLLVAKEIGVMYIYDLSGITGFHWNPKARYLFNDKIKTEDDVYMFITGMNKEQYKKQLSDWQKSDSHLRK